MMTMVMVNGGSQGDVGGGSVTMMVMVVMMVTIMVMTKTMMLVMTMIIMTIMAVNGDTHGDVGNDFK